MITAEQKPFEEIREMIAPYQRILVLGCASCVAECAAGGQKETAMLASTLRMKGKMEGEEKIIEEHTLDRQCVNDFVIRLDDIIEGYDAILSLGCGAGVQAVQEMYGEIPVIPALNTEFIGETRAQGLWVENCLGCGDCMLYHFGGVCPLARCSKQLFNGPCGGSVDGKCEINPDIDCAWQLIIDRLSSFGALDRLEGIYPPKNWSKKQGGGPRRIVREDQQK
ncbi:MAG: methylenetetrahydrofolate reductase C-terminal domain-containing protein [Desulfatiglans sp.]|jgi:NAD-dependent dihydropyrimidine dehydrogenase PreA subunit|nr:methylenetetrahydrofolate reductase C-terminal domain-containing protein [Thermodesulfobacteriota bacterium]MEE4354665.1 methylenetetrahydrofolate reductase C-terminal domain-containing protein [Desulfatiglans sp.]